MSRLDSTSVQVWAEKRKTFTTRQVASHFKVKESQARSAISILRIKEAVTPANPPKTDSGDSVWVASPSKLKQTEPFSANAARPYLSTQKVVTPKQLARKFGVETQQAIAVIAYLSRTGELLPAVPDKTKDGQTRWTFKYVPQ